VGSLVTTSRDRDQKTNLIKNKQEMAEKGAPHLLMTEEKKILCFRDERISWTSIKSDLSDAGVSVSSKTTRSRLADVRLKGRIS
ncbi:hypothetical protein TNCV_5083811, partial [Trichonephila clavipes]